MGTLICPAKDCAPLSQPGADAEPHQPHPPFSWEYGGHALHQGLSHSDSTGHGSESQARHINKMRFKHCERASMRCSGGSSGLLRQPHVQADYEQLNDFSGLFQNEHFQDLEPCPPECLSGWHEPVPSKGSFAAAS